MTRPRSEAPATAFAVALLDEFVRLGVRDVVVSPGSRSQALALAAVEFERLGLLRLRVRIDERVAGFLAIGLAVESGRPVLVVTTSGTAVANLHPAVLEAHHSCVPIIVVSADRPESMRGIGGNQTTEQPGIFGAAVRHSWDIGAPTGEPGETDAAAAVARDAFAAASGPVHINLAFTEPLSSPVSLPETEGDWGPLPEPGATPLAPAAVRLGTAASPPELVEGAPPIELHPEPGTIVVAGTGAGERAEQVARELGVPLLAEVASGAHFGPNLVVAYRELINTANFGDRVSRVIVFGHPTLSREVPALIQRPGVRSIVVTSRSADRYNPGHAVEVFADSVSVIRHEDSPAARAWLGRWVSASRDSLESRDDSPAVGADAAEFARAELAAVRAPVSRRSLVEAVWRATWPHDRLVLGASRLIREADKVVTGKKISVHANRGLAGIDGTISTAMGIALASQADGMATNAGDPATNAGDPATNANGPGGAATGPATPAAATAQTAGAAAGTTRVLLGDLALLHDVGALLFGLGEAEPRIQVIVGNDGGGTIFDGLEVAQSADPDAFDRVLLTAQRVSIEGLAAAYGWEYRHVDGRGQLDQALTASTGPALIEVPLPR